jgi:multidrug efflux pump subunit AcrA (membrane-fusion protein)
MVKDSVFKVGLMLVLAAALAACSKPTPPAEPVRSVKVMTVGVQGAGIQLEYAGEVRARIESTLGFRVGGKLLERLIEPGQRVKAGQLLARLDAQDLTLAADAARAQVAAARTNRDLAAADFKRYTERNQAAYTSLRADAPGVVTAVLAERGQVLAAGSPVLQLAQDGARDVVFAVPEDKVAAIKVGTPAVVKVWSSAGTLKGVVREVAASADPATRTFTVKVALQATDALALGGTVSVLPQALQTVGVPVIKLPTSALWQQGQTTAVWVLDPASMTVKPQTVQVATADGNDVVVSAGLQPGMQVVVAGVHVLAPGQKVTLYKASSAP